MDRDSMSQALLQQEVTGGTADRQGLTVSSSVAAGEPLQRKPMTLRAPLSMSPSMAGKLLLAGKNAKKFGDCQCVSPAGIFSSQPCTHQPSVAQLISVAALGILLKAMGATHPIGHMQPAR